MPRLRSILLWRLHPASYQGHLSVDYDLFGQAVGHNVRNDLRGEGAHQWILQRARVAA